MKKLALIIVFATLAIGLTHCSAEYQQDAGSAPPEAANKSDQTETQPAPETTPPDELKGKSDADK